MKIGLQDTNWSYIGAKLAQAEFFKSLAKECSTWGTNYQVETQFAAVNHLLTSKEREILSQITYEEEENQCPQ